MSWREQLQAASFRGVHFYVDSHQLSGGRDLSVKKSAKKDEPGIEDMGRRSRELSMEAYVIGEDYLDQRNALIEALEKKGPGKLSHPFLGSFNIAIKDFRLRESTGEGGVARFSISFLESKEQVLPTREVDTRAAVNAAADRAEAQAKEDFIDKQDNHGLSEDRVLAIQVEIERVLLTVDVRIEGLDSYMHQAEALADVLYEAVSGLTKEVADAREAILKLSELFEAGLDAKATVARTPRALQQWANQLAAYALMQRAAIIEAARMASEAVYDAVSEAQATLDLITEALDKMLESIDALGQGVSDRVYQALTELRRDLVNDIRERATQLPRISEYPVLASLPALVLAHQVYGDARREAEIIKRNALRHPGFVTGGAALEVLLDV